MLRDLKTLLSWIAGIPVIGEIAGPGLAGVAAFGLMLCCESFRQIQQMQAETSKSHEWAIQNQKSTAEWRSEQQQYATPSQLAHKAN